jgi:hypothetical protein
MLPLPARLRVTLKSSPSNVIAIDPPLVSFAVHTQLSQV